MRYSYMPFCIPFPWQQISSLCTQLFISAAVAAVHEEPCCQGADEMLCSTRTAAPRRSSSRAAAYAQPSTAAAATATKAYEKPPQQHQSSRMRTTLHCHSPRRRITRCGGALVCRGDLLNLRGTVVQLSVCALSIRPSGACCRRPHTEGTYMAV